jgi:2-polyprenyl-3-methyl-5-hydroxy-6-metoxy-1,4-benzoquinol methylase
MLSAARANRYYFRQAYRTGQHGWEVTKPSPYALKSLRFVKCKIPGGRLLDIGCGEGRHSIAAAEAVYEYCRAHSSAEIAIGEGCGSGVT